MNNAALWLFLTNVALGLVQNLILWLGKSLIFSLVRNFIFSHVQNLNLRLVQNSIAKWIRKFPQPPIQFLTRSRQQPAALFRTNLNRLFFGQKQFEKKTITIFEKLPFTLDHGSCKIISTNCVKTHDKTMKRWKNPKIRATVRANERLFLPAFT